MEEKTPWRVFRDVVFVLTIVGSVFYSLADQFYGQECNAFHPECGDYEYCGVDNQCHQFPVEETTTMVREETIETQRFVLPASLLGLGLIAVVVVGRKRHVW